MKYAILCFDFDGFTNMMYVDPVKTINIIYELRHLCRKVVGDVPTNYGGDSVNLLIDDIDKAIIYGEIILKEFKYTLFCTIGYGEFYFTKDDFFSTEFNEAIHLQDIIPSGKIYFTKEAERYLKSRL